MIDQALRKVLVREILSLGRVVLCFPRAVFLIVALVGGMELGELRARKKRSARETESGATRLDRSTLEKGSRK